MSDSFEVLCGPYFVGKIIGKNGMHLKKIKEEVHCKKLRIIYDNESHKFSISYPHGCRGNALFAVEMLKKHINSILDKESSKSFLNDKFGSRLNRLRNQNKKQISGQTFVNKSKKIVKKVSKDDSENSKLTPILEDKTRQIPGLGKKKKRRNRKKRSGGMKKSNSSISLASESTMSTSSKSEFGSEDSYGDFLFYA